MGNFFHSPRKVTGQNLDKFKVPCKCDRSDYKYQPVTAEGELTLEGVYEQFLLDMQNDRHWSKSTCILAVCCTGFSGDTVCRSQ